MSVPLKYETPENVQIEYRPAGLGTRFIAWFVDQIILKYLSSDRSSADLMGRPGAFKSGTTIW